jgi:hypothetical protein
MGITIEIPKPVDPAVEQIEHHDLPDPTLNERDVLLLAANLIEEHGWCRGMLRSENGRLCTLGAINMAATGDACLDIFDGEFIEPEVCAHAKEILGDHLGFGWAGIDFWNDHLKTGLLHGGSGQKKVARALREAADTCA